MEGDVTNDGRNVDMGVDRERRGWMVSTMIREEVEGESRDEIVSCRAEASFRRPGTKWSVPSRGEGCSKERKRTVALLD